MIFSDRNEIFTLTSTKNPTLNVEQSSRQNVKENLIRDLKPIFQVARIFGLAPYSMSNSDLTLSKNGLIYSGILFIFYCCVYFFRVRASVQKCLALKIIIMYIIIMSTSAFCIILDIVFCVLWDEKQQEFFELIRSYDISRKSENPAKNRFANWSWIVLLGNSAIILTIVGIACFFDIYPIKHGAVSYFLFCSSFSLGILKFLALAMMICIRFQALNRQLTEDLSYIVELSDFHRKLYLQEVWKRHECLTASARILNSMYTVKLLIWFSTLSLTSTLQLYGVIMDNHSNICFVIRRGLIALLFIILLIAIAIVCHLTASEANRMGGILSSPKYFQHCNSSGKQDIFLIGQNFQFNSFHFSAIGLFNINLPVLLTTASAITTYLVILISPSERG